MIQLTNNQLEALRDVSFNVPSYLNAKLVQGSSFLAPKPSVLNSVLPNQLQSILVVAYQNGYKHETKSAISKELPTVITWEILEILDHIWGVFLDYFDEEQETFWGLNNIETNALCIIALDQLEADQIITARDILKSSGDPSKEGYSNEFYDYCWGIIQGLYPKRFKDKYITHEQEILGRLYTEIRGRADRDFKRETNKMLYDNLMIIIQGNSKIREILMEHIKQVDPEKFKDYYTKEELDEIYNKVKPFIESDFKSYNSIKL